MLLVCISVVQSGLLESRSELTGSISRSRSQMRHCERRRSSLDFVRLEQIHLVSDRPDARPLWDHCWLHNKCREFQCWGRQRSAGLQRSLRQLGNVFRCQDAEYASSWVSSEDAAVCIAKSISFV